jgi:uncharacterized membrane protein
VWERKRYRIAGMLLGLGFGGFVDGILLHQILQWHHMLTSTGDHPATTIAGLETNTLWDGLFHLGTWIAAFVGLVMITTAIRNGFPGSSTYLFGLLLVGWGTFNVVEGLIDHHVLGIHHVRAGANQALYDVAFLAFGAALLVGGLMMSRHGERQSVERDHTGTTGT